MFVQVTWLCNGDFVKESERKVAKSKYKCKHKYKHEHKYKHKYKGG